MALLVHIPHSSKCIPENYLQYFKLTLEALNNEMSKMTDHYTDEMFDCSGEDVQSLLFPISLLLVDPERF